VVSDGIREIDMKLSHNILLVSFVPALLQAASLKPVNPVQALEPGLLLPAKRSTSPTD
jgi:hypothetical protein